MRWQSHRLIGVSVAVFSGEGLVPILLSYIGSTLPDVVEGKPPQEGSIFYKRGMRSWRKSHRGSSHWFGWYLGLAIIGLQINQDLAWLGIGALTHLFADSLTPMGIPVLPFSKRKMISFNLFSTGGVGEFFFSASLLFILIFYLHKQLFS